MLLPLASRNLGARCLNKLAGARVCPGILAARNALEALHHLMTVSVRHSLSSRSECWPAALHMADELGKYDSAIEVRQTRASTALHLRERATPRPAPSCPNPLCRCCRHHRLRRRCHRKGCCSQNRASVLGRRRGQGGVGRPTESWAGAAQALPRGVPVGHREVPQPAPLARARTTHPRGTCSLPTRLLLA